MKKTACMILALVMCLGISVMLVACGHEHEWQEVWSFDEAYHWRSCAKEGCAEIGEKAEHTWDGGKVIDPPTADEEGKKLFTCNTCGEAVMERIIARRTVSAAEWERALSLSIQNAGAENYTVVRDMITQREDGTSAEIRETTRRVGGVLQRTSLNPNLPSENANRNTVQVYYAKRIEEGVAKFYRYDVTYKHDELDEFAQNVEIREIPEEEYTAGCDAVMLHSIFAYQDFTYRDLTGQYEAQAITIGEVVYADVTLSFVDGKLVRYTYTQTRSGTVTKVTAHLEYDGKDGIILPSLSE